jgi:hypothetical protein
MAQDLGLSERERLFLQVVSGVRQTYEQIAVVGECAAMEPSKTSQDSWQTVQVIARTSLQLLEAYEQAVRQDADASCEALSISQVLHDAANALQPYATTLQVSLALDVPKRPVLVLANRQVLNAALTSLGQLFLQAQSERSDGAPVVLGAHLSRHGVVAGCYGKGLQLSTAMLRRARALRGRAAQPMPALVSGSVAGMFLADSLLQSASGGLHVGRFRNTAGLAATLPRCQQLQLV